MRETEFNVFMRGVLRRQGLRAQHIKEADQPGVPDLVTYKGQRLLAWVELKVGDEEVRTSQAEWMREETSLGGNCLVVRLVDEDQLAVAVARWVGDDLKLIKSYPNFYKVNWYSLLVPLIPVES